MEKLSTNDAANLTTMLFIFSFIWSCGGNLHDNQRDNSRLKFSTQLKTKIFNIHNGFPFDGDIYDYYIDF